MGKKQQLISYLCTTLLVLAFAAFFITVAGANVGEGIAAFTKGVFGSANGMAEILVKATPLIFMGLGCSVAFRTGFFNLGAEGQFYMGALAAIVVGLYCPFTNRLTTVLAIAAAFAAGGLWALISALLKAKLKISEVITTIMLNYIAINIIGLLIRTILQDPAGSVPQTEKLDPSVLFPLLFPPTRVNFGIFLAIIFVFVVWMIMERTTLGYELRAVGYNSRAAKVNGISVIKSVIISTLLSGGLAGIAGSVEILGIQKKLVEGISSGAGYTAILIALLAKNNPIAVVFIAIFYAALQVGAGSMQRSLGVPSSLVDVIMGLVVVLVLCKTIFQGRKGTK